MARDDHPDHPDDADRADRADRASDQPDLGDDDVLLQELGLALAAERAVSERAREAARAAYSWRTIDEELMQLAHDSALSEELLVRGVAEARVIGFSGRMLTLEIELDGGRLTGQVVPARACRVTVQSESGGEASAESDESGVFTLEFDANGPVRFVIDVAGQTQRTVWITL